MSIDWNFVVYGGHCKQVHSLDWIYFKYIQQFAPKKKCLFLCDKFLLSSIFVDIIRVLFSKLKEMEPYEIRQIAKKNDANTGITQLQSSIIFSLILLQLMFAVVLANHCYGFWFPLLSVGCKAYCKCFSVAENQISLITQSSKYYVLLIVTLLSNNTEQ